MLTLHARMADPMSRLLRLALIEKRASHHIAMQQTLVADGQLRALDPDGRTPILVDNGAGLAFAITEVWPMIDYLEDVYPSPSFFPGGPMERAQIRTLAIQARRTLGPLVEVAVEEKWRKRLEGSGSPDMAAMRRAIGEAHRIITQIGQAAEASDWIYGRKMSLADLVAAAHISVLDWLDVISWDGVPQGKAWYQRIKQRPSFQPLLADHWPGMAKASHYADLDF